MPRTKTNLSPAEHAVLGLIRERPTYGYELKSQLGGARGLGRVCPVEPAMVYAILRSLAGFELIDGEWDDSSRRKAIYTITAEGARAFDRWLRQPAERMRDVRSDFLIKLFFALREDRALARDLLRAQIAAVRGYEEEVTSQQDVPASTVEEFDAIVLESKASAARITLEWLEQCLDRLAEPSRVPSRGSRATRR